MKTLLLMRHAKSDWGADYGVDHDRPLNDRGVHSARAIGKALVAGSAVPDLVISSSAVRARATADLASEAGGWKCDVVIEPRLYGSGADVVVDVATGAPDVGRLMLVGHQPTWSIVVSILTGGQVEMKTATVACIDFEVERWPDLAEARGRVTDVYRARDLV